MKWQLAHFGLDLTEHSGYIDSSICEIRKSVDLSKGVGATHIPNSVLDSRLNGPRTEQTLLTSVGHIVLQVPVARPECLDQIVEIVNGYSENVPLKKFEKNYEVYFSRNDRNAIDEVVVDPNEVYEMLLRHGEEIIIHGDEQTAHNVEGLAEEMMLKVLPVPSILVRNQPELHTSKLNQKLNTIIKLNNQLADILCAPVSPVSNTNDDSDLPSEVPSFSRFTEIHSELAKDVIHLLSYHVMTYLDNTIPGMPSDSNLDAGVAQYLGKPNLILQGGSVDDMEVGGTSLQRIVRSINSGETVINVQGTSEDLCFELSKQIAFQRIWENSMRDTQLIHIDDCGEIKRMEIGVIQGFQWSHWNGRTDFGRQEFVAPRYSKTIMDRKQENSYLNEIIEQIVSIDDYFRLDVPTHFAATYLYSLISQLDSNVVEQQIVICDVKIDPIVLSPVLRHMREELNIGSKICLIFTGMVVKDAAMFNYTPTPDEYRNLIIALTELYERPEFEDKRQMFLDILPTELYLVSTYLKGLSRKKIMRIIGSVIMAKGRLNTEYIRDYIREILVKEGEDISHLNPNPRVKRRKLTTEAIYTNNKETELPNEDADSTPFSVVFGEDSDAEQTSRQSLYDSLKGLEPLVHWAKSKSNLFTLEAKEYGFVRYPTGLLLTGVPGCGKTMAAKIIAEEWGMELIRVNPDDITSRFMGGNEENMRKLLDKLVDMAPSICFIDEAEKLFSQVRTEDQTAATASIESTESLLLQFMEENQNPVFFIFTSNDITKMSPALVDRFDASFFVDLPDEKSRTEIIKLMLNERKKGDLEINYKILAGKSDNFTGRDIRGAIEEAMMQAYAQKRELNQEDLEYSFQQVTTTTSTHEKEINAMRSLVEQGKIRSANSPQIRKKDTSGFDVSVS